jgi:hypothetical protein
MPGLERQKLHIFFHMWKIQKRNMYTKEEGSHINSYVAHVSNSGTTL